VNGPQGDYYLSHVVAGQSTQSPCVDAGDPGTPLGDGTTRTDEVVDQGVIDMGYHYALDGGYSNVWISVSPTGSIIIPPFGGILDWNIEIGNSGTAPETADIWVDLTLPNGELYGPILGPIQDFTISPNWNANRDRELIVPGAAPEGAYSLNAYVGDYNLSIIIVEDHFSWSKSGVGESNGTDWFRDSGEGFVQHRDPGNLTPDAELLQNYPNPFNSSTTISYSIPTSGQAELRIYDVRGRLIHTLVKGYHVAGTYKVQFNSAGSSSGIYLVKLDLESTSHMRKILYIK
jgi:hypothetical protein